MDRSFTQKSIKNKSTTILSFLFLVCSLSISFIESGERGIEYKAAEIPKTPEEAKALEAKIEEHRKAIEKETAEKGSEFEKITLENEKLKAEQLVLDQYKNEISDKNPTQKEATKKELEKKLKEKVNEINKLAVEIQKGFTPVTPPSEISIEKEPLSFMQKTFLKLRQLWNEILFRQFRNISAILGKGNQALPGIRQNLYDIYSQLNKPFEQLNLVSKKWKPNSILEHLEVFKKALDDPKNTNAQHVIMKRLKKYLKQFTADEIQLELKANSSDIEQHYATLSKILENLGISKDTQAKYQDLQSPLQIARETAVAIKKQNALDNAIKKFFDNTAPDGKTFENFSKNKEIVRKQLRNNPIEIHLKKNIDDYIADLNDLRTSYLAIKDAENRTYVLSFLKDEYGAISNAAFNAIGILEKRGSYDYQSNKIKESAEKKLYKLKDQALNYVSEITNELRKELQQNQQKQRKEPAPYAAAFVEKTTAREKINTLNENTQSLAKNTIMNAIDALKTNISKPQTMNNTFAELLINIDTFIQDAAKADPSSESVSLEQTMANSIYDLIDLIKLQAAFFDATPEQIAIFANWIVTLDQKSSDLINQSEKDFKALIRISPGGVVELSQSKRTNIPEQKTSNPLQQAIFENTQKALEHKKISPEFTQQLQDIITKRLQDSREKMTTSESGGGGWE
jgi:hypothetical protein